jgi:hypothetical protein
LYYKYLLLLLSLPVFLQGFGQENTDTWAVKDSLVIYSDIFAAESPGEVTLIYNSKELRKRSNIDKYLKARLIYHLGDSASDLHKEVRIKARGNNRREICTYPPIWINIRKSDIQNKLLKDTKRIKLVTQCGGNKTYEIYVLKEYLAYRIYQEISPFSFRVRLIRMKYIDIGRKNREQESWTFLIEPEGMLAERLDMYAFKSDFMSMKSTDTLWTNNMAVFQYMIGNADFSITGRHNVKLLRYKDYRKPNVIPVPYDFDYCGMVNAHYAIPGENLGIKSVRERYFLGPCRPPGEYREVLDVFSGKREIILGLIREFEYLSERDRKEIEEYLGGFYIASESRDFIERRFLSTCR